MINIPVYNKEGKQVEEIALSDAVFGLERNDKLLHQVYIILSGNERQPIAHAKDRSERSGSGKKLWKQKHTGRARVGSVRSPLWRKGGVTFGPTSDRNFQRAINVKMRRKAVSVALSQKIADGKLIVVDSFLFETYKTTVFAKLLSALSIKGSAVVGFGAGEVPVKAMSRNIASVSPVLVSDINTKLLLDNQFIVLSKEAVLSLENNFFRKRNRFHFTYVKIIFLKKDHRKDQKADTAEVISAWKESVLLAPVVTEKAQSGVERNEYTFFVGREANKESIKAAVTRVYNVEVMGVAISIKKARSRNFGRIAGKTKAVKKAIVQIKKGQTINLFETSTK